MVIIWKNNSQIICFCLASEAGKINFKWNIPQVAFCEKKNLGGKTFLKLLDVLLFLVNDVIEVARVQEIQNKVPRRLIQVRNILNKVPRRLIQVRTILSKVPRRLIQVRNILSKVSRRLIQVKNILIWIRCHESLYWEERFNLSL